MGDLLEEGATALNTWRKAWVGRPVIYRRGDQSAELITMVGQPGTMAADGVPIVQDHTGRDYVFAAAELVLGSEVIEPRPGDRIEDSDGNWTLIWEVLDDASGRCWRPCDQYGVMIRVHVKLVGKE